MQIFLFYEQNEKEFSPLGTSVLFSFQSDLKISQEPFNLVPQVGCFEIVKSEDVSHGLVTRQVVLQPPIESCPWPHDLHFPMAIIGDYNW